MRAFEIEISKPTNADSFENMCTDVYGVVFEDPTPKRNGRSGQKQGGVDIFVEANVGRIGVQCKRYVDGGVTTKTIDDEVTAADASGWKIVRLILATTAASDTALVKHAQQLSDDRRSRGLFTVEVESWTEICNHIQRHDALHPKYSPNSPGGAIASIRGHTERTYAQISSLPSTVEEVIRATLADVLPAARSDSVNGIVTRQLDRVNELLRKLKPDAAHELLTALQDELCDFDEHQKARWTLQNGVVHWQQNRESIAAEWFLRAYEIFQDDDRIAANKIRAHIIQGEHTLANEEGRRLLGTFPMSLHVWLASTNARICESEDLTEADLPARFVNEPDALQMMAYAFHRQHSDLAVDYARRALKARDAGLFARKGAAGIIVSIAGRYAYMADFSVFSPELKAGLAEVIQAFSPVPIELWQIENRQHRTEAAAHVALAHMLTGAPDVALSICERIEAELPENADQVATLHLGALRFLQRYDAAIEFALTHLSDLDEDGLLLSAETAANLGDADAFGRFADALRNRSAAERPVLKLLDLVSRFNSGDRDTVLSEVTAMPLETLDLISLNGIAGLMFNAGRATEAHKCVEAIKRRVSVGSPVRDRLIAVDTLIRAEEYSLAISLLESVDPNNKSLPVQKRRLRALLLGGHRKKSKDLLDALPSEWLIDDALRRLAMGVAQEANDWSALERIALLHREAHPNSAESWVFWYQVVLHTRPPAKLREAFSEAPARLSGTPRQLAQLATAELQYGQQGQGYLRLYRMFREHLDDVAAASAYLMSITMGHRSQHETKEYAAVAPGTRIILEAADKSVVTVVIDPSEMSDLPKSATFIGANSPLAASILGRGRGDQVEIRGTFDSRIFTVARIEDAHFGLAEHANEILRKSIEPAPGLQVYELDKKDDGSLDVSPIHDRLKAETRRRRAVMEEYSGKKLPIGFCVRMMGGDAASFVFGWDHDSPPLASGARTTGEFEVARSILNSDTTPVVVDAVTLAELIRFGRQDLLAVLPKIYVSRGTYDRFKQAEIEASDPRTSGHAADIDGKFAFIPVTDEVRRWKAGRYAAVLKAIEDHCEICAVYGPDQMPTNLLFLKDVLDDDTYDVLTLCLEKQAALFSVDEHLRNWASGLFGVQSVFPYLVAMKAVDNRKLSIADYSRFVLATAMENRSIFSIKAADVLWGLQQPAIAVEVLRLASDHIASAIRLDYALDLARSLLTGILGVPMQYGVAAEISKHTAFGLFRRNDLPGDAREWFAKRLKVVAGSRTMPASPYPPVAEIPNKEVDAIYRMFIEAQNEGIAMARQEIDYQRPEIAALFCQHLGLIVHSGHDTSENEPCSVPRGEGAE